MNIEDIEEIVDIEKITVNPGKQSKVIHWDKGFLIVAAVKGNGLIRKVDEETSGRPLGCEAVIKIASSNDNKFKIVVPENKKEQLIAIIFKMSPTKNA